MECVGGQFGRRPITNLHCRHLADAAVGIEADGIRPFRPDGLKFELGTIYVGQVFHRLAIVISAAAGDCPSQKRARAVFKSDWRQIRGRIVEQHQIVHLARRAAWVETDSIAVRRINRSDDLVRDDFIKVCVPLLEVVALGCGGNRGCGRIALLHLVNHVSRCACLGFEAELDIIDFTLAPLGVKRCEIDIVGSYGIAIRDNSPAGRIGRPANEIFIVRRRGLRQ